MNLNIYTINHPIVRNSINYICNNQSNIIETREILSQLGYILFYEATRKSMNLVELNIKKLNIISEIALIPKHISYIVFSEVHSSHIFSKKIYDIIPKAIILTYDQNLVKYNENIKVYNVDKLKMIEMQSNIFIIQMALDACAVLKIFSLIEEKKIIVEQIQILCVVCSIEALQKISQKYIKLNIYTTKIIQNKQTQSLRFLKNN